MAGNPTDPNGSEQRSEFLEGKTGDTGKPVSGSLADMVGRASGPSDNRHSLSPPIWYSPAAVGELIGVGERRARQILRALGVEKIAGRYLLTSENLGRVQEARIQHRGGTSRMSRVAAKATAMDALLRLGKRIGEQEAKLEKLTREVWASTKLAHDLLDQIAEVRRVQLDCIKRKLEGGRK